MNTSYLVYWSLLEDFFGVKNWSYPYFKWDFFYSVDFKYYEHYYPSGYIGYNSSSKYIYTRDLKKFRGFDLIDEILDKYSNKRGIPKGVLEYHLDWFIAQYPMDSDWGLVHIHYCDPLSDEIVFMICREFFRINSFYDFLITYRTLNPIYSLMSYYIKMFFCFINDSTIEVGFMEYGLMFNDFQTYFYFFEAYEFILWIQLLSWGWFFGIWLDIGHFFRFQRYLNKSSFKFNKGYIFLRNPWGIKMNGVYFMIKKPIWMVPIPIKELDLRGKFRFLMVFLFFFIFFYIFLYSMYWIIHRYGMVYYGDRMQPWFIDNDEEGWLFDFGLTYDDLESKEVKRLKRLRKARLEGEAAAKNSNVNKKSVNTNTNKYNRR